MAICSRNLNGILYSLAISRRWMDFMGQSLLLMAKAHRKCKVYMVLDVTFIPMNLTYKTDRDNRDSKKERAKFCIFVSSPFIFTSTPRRPAMQACINHLSPATIHKIAAGEV